MPSVTRSRRHVSCLALLVALLAYVAIPVSRAQAACSTTYPVGSANDGVVSFLATGGEPVFAATTFQAVEEGSLVYDSTTNSLKICDGTQWTALLTAAGGGSSQWVNGTGGTIYYNGGNVGIGNDTPQHPLDVTGTATANAMLVKPTTGLAAPGSGSALNLDALGDVVIATPAGGQLLAYNGTSSKWENQTIGGAGISADSLDFTEFKDALALDASTDIAVDGTEVLSVTNTGTGNSFVVNDAASDTTPFLIDASGRIGIGTTSPSAALHVADLASNTISVMVSPNAPAYGVAIDAGATGGGWAREFGFSYGGSKLGSFGFYATAGTPTYAYINANQAGAVNGYSGPDLVVTSAGHVGIGIAAPSYRLDIRTPDSSRVINTRSFNTLGQYHHVFQNNSGTDVGNILVSTTATQFNTSSDRRIKDDIVPTSAGLAELLKLNVYDFVFKSDSLRRKHVGFMAQEVKELFPDAVATNGDDGVQPLADGKEPWSVDYGRLTPLLVKSIQELKAANDHLTADNGALKKQLQDNAHATAELRAQLHALQVKLDALSEAR